MEGGSVRTVAVVGVGLIGGSFALALREAGFTGRILGVSSPRTLAEAQERGVIDEGLPLAEAVPQADLVFLAQPVQIILDSLETVAGLVRPDALVTDAGSTKRVIVARARALFAPHQFLGGHPMAGKEQRGVAAAEWQLFRDRTWLLTPLQEGHEPRPPIWGWFMEWLQRFGAKVLVLTPEQHDRVVARTSHLPQLLSVALGVTVNAVMESSQAAQLAGPGLRDMLRLACSSYDIWEDIINTNQDEIEAALTEFLETFGRVRDDVRRGDVAEAFQTAAGTGLRVRI